jgi:hypothetical protein
MSFRPFQPDEKDLHQNNPNVHIGLATPVHSAGRPSETGCQALQAGCWSVDTKSWILDVENRAETSHQLAVVSKTEENREDGELFKSSCYGFSCQDHHVQIFQCVSLQFMR